ncbi:MAG: segregation/condensation protein A [Thermoguttaceae bacterium]|nr:segregation/condensation protein A [Thermoguttaceae bacterium]MBR0225324.1 segregation/condensation protein A [Thermoguttaceae bacterium]
MFSVKLDAFCGPVDLLLYLVRKRELDVFDIPIAEVTDQFLLFIEALEALNLETIGDFITMASMLIEIKSFQALPCEEERESEEIEDPRKDLVVQLLAYRKFCENAGMLEERGRRWQRRYPRLANDVPVRARNFAEEPIQNVELWDLVGAFGRILREKAPVFKHSMKREDTPTEVHVQRVYSRIKREGSVRFTALFAAADRKATLIGIFLAILELVRHGYARVEQQETFADIIVSYRENEKPFDLLETARQIDLAQAG